MQLGFLNLLTLIFVGLKVANIIDWSWFLVLMPTIVSVVIGLFCLVILTVFTSKNSYF